MEAVIAIAMTLALGWVVNKFVVGIVSVVKFVIIAATAAALGGLAVEASPLLVCLLLAYMLGSSVKSR